MKLIALFAILCANSAAWAKLKVIGTTSDVAAIIASVAGDKVDVSSIAKGTQDAHQIEAKPSFMVRMRDADLVIAHGLELEDAWLVPLIQGARNPKVKIGERGYLALASRLDPIEIPQGPVSRAQGDVHPGGNPHFHLDPVRIGLAAVLIADKLGELDSENRDYYHSNADKLQKRMTVMTKVWKKRLDNTRIKEVVTYHKTFSYFLNRFAIQNSLQLEPRPGIPPTAAHLIEVIAAMKKKNINLVLIESYFDDKAGNKIKQELPAARIVQLPVSVGGEAQVSTNEQLIERLVQAIEGGTH